MREAEQILRSRLNFQGTTMGFSTEKSDALWWLMISADSNANELLLALSDAPAWREDVPRLVTGSAVPHAARALEHDGGQRLGRAGDGEIFGRVREDRR